MAQFASDTFTNTQYTELSAHNAAWSKQTGYSGDLIIGQGGTYVIRNDNITFGCYQHSGAPASADYSVSADIAVLNTNGASPQVSVAGRMQAAAETFYFAIWGETAGNIRLFKMVGGTQTQLGSSYTYTLTTTPARLELVMVGDQISVKLDGSTIIGPVTDAEISTAGKAGIRLIASRETGVNDATSLDNFSADDAADTTAPTLTSPTGTGGVLVCSGSVTTSEANGTLYTVATASATAPSAAQVKAGQDHTGAAALRVVSQAVSGTSLTVASGAVSAGTRYLHYMHEDAATNQSTVVSSSSFSVTGGGDTTPPTLSGSITVGTVTSTSIQITWPAGSDDTAVTSYETSPDGTNWTDRGNVLTYTFTSLTPSTSYTFRVRAKDAAANVSTPPIQVTQSTSGLPALTSSALKNNTGTLLTSAAAEAYVSNPSTGALVVKKTGLTSHATTGVIAFSDAALTAATSYRVVWRLTATGAEGLETLTAT